ncbi:MAG: methyl-accepting chemotaxis protein [Deltaproteobacteria bacterium]|nr:methyl-accepting chemotaxis protein [Deltaproteobacteria bacterium]
MLRNFSIGMRITAIISILILAMACLVGTIILTADSVKDHGIADAEEVMLEGERAKIALGTHTIAKSLGKALEGVTDPEQQAAIIGKHINDIRFEADASGYYFVYRGTTVFVHPIQPTLVGKDLGSTPDANGVYYVSELNKAAQRGGGFVSFIFGKPQPGGGVANAPKLAYVEMIPGTDLWISTGIYIDNIDVYKAGMEKRMSDNLFNRMLIVIGCVLALVLCILLPLCIFTLRSISRPLRATTRAAEQIASGNLDVHLETDGKDEVTVLQQSLLRMAQNLRESFTEIRKKEAESLAKADEAQKAVRLAQEASRKADAANEEIMQAAARLETAAHEMESFTRNISRSTAGVREGTSTQDGRIHEILTAMEQLSASVLEVARGASSASRQTEESRVKVESGAALAKQSGTAMNEMRSLTDTLTKNIHKLGEQSRNIGQVINVINDIADQTNLLALNAAIEAARAGEAGRGFAVVAGEVRKLAEKTMQATREVGDSILAVQNLAETNISSMDAAMTSMNRVSGLSEETVAALAEVQGMVKEAAAQVQSIATAVEEQSASSSEVAALVGEVSSIASANTALVTEADEELQGLVRKAGELLGLVADLRKAEK